MSADPTALENLHDTVLHETVLHDTVLHDIVVPGATPWWPPAPGWYWIMCLLALLAAVMLWRALVRWQRNCYRREALAELARIEAAVQAAGPGEDSADKALPALAELLKRAALTAYPRAQVAALTGPAWFAFLDETGGTQFSAGLGAVLAQGNYQTGEQTGERDDTAVHTADIAREVRHWIRQHGKVEGAQLEGAIPAAHPHSSDKRSPAEAS